MADSLLDRLESLQPHEAERVLAARPLTLADWDRMQAEDEGTIDRYSRLAGRLRSGGPALAASFAWRDLGEALAAHRSREMLRRDLSALEGATSWRHSHYGLFWVMFWAGSYISGYGAALAGFAFSAWLGGALLALCAALFVLGLLCLRKGVRTNREDLARIARQKEEIGEQIRRLDDLLEKLRAA
jgi:hypothetical protein